MKLTIDVKKENKEGKTMKRRTTIVVQQRKNITGFCTEDEPTFLIGSTGTGTGIVDK